MVVAKYEPEYKVDEVAAIAPALVQYAIEPMEPPLSGAWKSVPEMAAVTPPVAVVLSIEERIDVRPRVEVVAFAKSAVVPVRFVPVKFVAKKFVVVAEVPVASAKSKFTKCEVLEA